MRSDSLPCGVMQCHLEPCSAMQCHAEPCSVMQCHADPCSATQCQARGPIHAARALRQLMLCHAVPCCRSCCAMQHHAATHVVCHATTGSMHGFKIEFQCTHAGTTRGYNRAWIAFEFKFTHAGTTVPRSASSVGPSRFRGTTHGGGRSVAGECGRAPCPRPWSSLTRGRMRGE